MNDYIRELEAELVRAGRERQRQRTGYRGRNVPGLSFGEALTALGATAAVAVAILAIVLAGQTRPRPVADQAAGIRPG